MAGYRTRLFLGLYWQIHTEWQLRLAARRCVAFEDMDVHAAERSRGRPVDCGYAPDMVEGFQDVSQARARLVRDD